MANSNSTMIKKLQTAINAKGGRILYSTSQFYSETEGRPITKYHIKKSIWEEETQRNRNIELFSSCSQIQIVLFLRDLWYEMNDLPVPEDNEEWEKRKSEYEKH